MNKLIIGLFLLSCSSPNPPSTAQRALVEAAVLVSPNGACFDPGAPPYNAVPDDNRSDRIALQAAANDAAAWSVAHESAPTVVCLGAGKWNCDRAPVSSYNRFSCVSVHSGNVVFAGVGEATKIALEGDQHQGDIIMMSHDPGASGGYRDLMVVSDNAYNTSEQTHLLGTTGVCDKGNCVPIRNISFKRIICDHPVAIDGNRKGDCIRLLGNAPPTDVTPGTGIYGVIIEDSEFRRCARSGIQPQRGVHNLIIRRNKFWCDQPIHGEATGGTQAGENDAADIYENTFNSFGYNGNGEVFSSDVDIALSGTAFPYTGIHIHNNRLGRGIYLYRTANAVIDHEQITMSPRTGYGVIEISNVCDGLSISNVNVTRNGFAGPVLRMTPHSGAVCKNVRITDSTWNQNTLDHIVYSESVSGVLFENNVLTWTKPAPKFAGFYARSTVVPITDVVLRGNQFIGAGSFGAMFSAAPYAFGAGIEVSGNIVVDTTADGVVCNGAGGFAPIMSFGNTFGSVACPGVVFIQP